MAYQTGTGANIQDFVDALRSFASGLGWTINRWDTTAKRLYLSKGICRVCMLWESVNTTIYAPGATTTSVVSEGRIKASLVQTIGAADDFSTFAGCAVKSGSLSNSSAPVVFMGNMQGPFTSWFLFSNATGDYIHAMVQTSADMYTFFGFGIGDKGGLTHSGVAYLFSEGSRYWYQSASAATVATSSAHYQNKAGYTASAFANSNGRRFGHSTMQLYTENALPAGWLNNYALANYYDSTFSNTAHSQTSMALRNSNIDMSKPSTYLSSGNNAFKLCDPVIVASAPGYSPYVPMFGLPLIAVSNGYSLACALGSIPDLRIINMSSLTPQQELTLGADVWKVFPQLRQTPWSEVDALGFLLPTSGQFGLAFKKVA